MTIHIDVPVTINFHELKANAPDTSALAKYFGELEFRSLANKFAGIVSTSIEKNVRVAVADSTRRADKSTAVESPVARDVIDINYDKHDYH